MIEFIYKNFGFDFNYLSLSYYVNTHYHNSVNMESYLYVMTQSVI